MSESAGTAVIDVRVEPPMPVDGRGGVKYVTNAVIDVSGVEIAINGLTVRLERRAGFSGTLTVAMSVFRDPTSGAWRNAITLPAPLARAVARVTLEQLPGTLFTTPLESE